MSERNIGTRRVSGRQLDLLWDYLNSHRDIAAAFNRSLQAKEYSKRKWMEIAEILNSQGEGAHKDWRGWSKYWVDYKAKLKKRAAALRSSQSRTGGGPSSEQPLSDLERKFLQILGEDSGQGLPGVRVEPFVEPSGSTAVAESQQSSASESIFDRIVVVESPLATANEAAHLEASLENTDPPNVDPPPHSPSQTPPPPIQRPAIVAAAARRQRRRRDPPMTPEVARRSLVQTSQRRAEIAQMNAQALERIGQVLEDINGTLQRLERFMNGVFPRAAE